MKPTKKTTTKRQPTKKGIKVSYKITLANCKQIDSALEGLTSLFKMTKQYESTVEYFKVSTGALKLIRTWYAAHTGPMTAALEFPYTAAELRSIFTQAKQIYSYATNNATKEKTESLFIPVVQSFDLAIARAVKLEEGGLDETNP